MKKTGIVVILLLLLSLQQVAAADVFSRIIHNDQDALIIGEIINEIGGSYRIEVKHVVSGRLAQKNITISSDFKYYLTQSEPSLGDYLVLSLEKKVLNYIIKYGAFKVSSADYKTLTFEGDFSGLSKGRQGDLAALEWYVNSNGTENDFFYKEDEVYIRKANREEILIFDGTINLFKDKDKDKDKDQDSNITTFNPKDPQGDPSTNAPPVKKGSYGNQVIGLVFIGGIGVIYMVKKK